MTNAIVERTVEQQIVYVTNTIVEIQPANPQVIYVPQYNPTVVYEPPPTYVYYPLVPLLTFGAGIAVGAIIATTAAIGATAGFTAGGGGFRSLLGRRLWAPSLLSASILRLPSASLLSTGRLAPAFTRICSARLRSAGIPPATRLPSSGPGPRPPVATPYPGQGPVRPSSPVASQTPATMERWQPDQSRLRTAGAPSTSQNLAQRLGLVRADFGLATGR